MLKKKMKTNSIILSIIISLLCLKTSHMFQFPLYNFKFKNLKELKLYVVRSKIDQIDDKLYCLLEKRQKLVKETTPYKDGVRDPLREIAILARLQKKGNELDKDFVKHVWVNIFMESCQIQSVETSSQEHPSDQ